jgi:hypothetical protein
VEEGDRPTIPTQCPIALAELMQSCWSQRPAERPTPEGVLQILKGGSNRHSTDAGDPSELVCVAGVGSGGRKRVDVRLEAANGSRTLVVEGAAQDGGEQYACMGRYRLVEGKVLNGRGVWRQEEGEGGQQMVQRVGGSARGGEEPDRDAAAEPVHGECYERYLYHASYDGGDWQSEAWWVGKRETMESGEAWGWMQVASDALTPVQAVGAWQVWAGEEGGEGEWLDEPGLIIRTEEEAGGAEERGTKGEGNEVEEKGKEEEGKDKRVQQVESSMPVEVELQRRIAQLEAENEKLSAVNSQLTESNESLLATSHSSGSQ